MGSHDGLFLENNRGVTIVPIQDRETLLITLGHLKLGIKISG